MSDISVTVNGKQKQYHQDSTINDVLILHNLVDTPVAVEKNRQIIKRTDYSTTILQDGDVIEILRFVGGGL